MKPLYLLLSLLLIYSCNNQSSTKPDYFDSCMIFARKQADSVEYWYHMSRTYREGAWEAVRQRDSVIELLKKERAKPKHYDHVEKLIIGGGREGHKDGVKVYPPIKTKTLLIDYSLSGVPGSYGGDTSKIILFPKKGVTVDTIWSKKKTAYIIPYPAPLPDTVKPRSHLASITRLTRDSISSVAWPISRYIESDSLPVIVHFKGDTLNYIVHRNGKIEIHNLNLDVDSVWYGSTFTENGGAHPLLKTIVNPSLPSPLKAPSVNWIARPYPSPISDTTKPVRLRHFFIGYVGQSDKGSESGGSHFTWGGYPNMKKVKEMIIKKHNLNTVAIVSISEYTAAQAKQFWRDTDDNVPSNK